MGYYTCLFLLLDFDASKELFMKIMLCILVAAFVVSGCDDMKMDKKVAKNITFSAVVKR